VSEDRRSALRERIAVLSEFSRRALAAAIARETGAATTLTAYLVLEHGSAGAHPVGTPTDEQLRAFLAERLPAYMIPARFATLERLPRTAAGKLDRRALKRETGTGLETAATTVVAPRSPIEAKLAGIWRDVLRVDEISVHDDFFEIGGDSLSQGSAPVLAHFTASTMAIESAHHASRTSAGTLSGMRCTLKLLNRSRSSR
jgi:hypothetical protein